MKKTLLVASVACACALAANAQFDPWFTGIGDGATTANLNPTNGTWRMPAASDGDYEYTSNKLEFDLDDNVALEFAAEEEMAPDTNTITVVTVTGDFTPVKYAEFPTNGLMVSRQAQVGFLVGVDNGATNYYAWVGTPSGRGWAIPPPAAPGRTSPP